MTAPERLAWHFLHPDSRLRTGETAPADGEWLKHDGPIVPCESGLHASERVIDALDYIPTEDQATRAAWDAAYAAAYDARTAADATWAAAYDAWTAAAYADWAAQNAELERLLNEAHDKERNK